RSAEENDVGDEAQPENRRRQKRERPAARSRSPCQQRAPSAELAGITPRAQREQAAQESQATTPSARGAEQQASTAAQQQQPRVDGLDRGNGLLGRVAHEHGVRRMQVRARNGAVVEELRELLRRKRQPGAWRLRDLSHPGATEAAILLDLAEHLTAL